MEPSTADQSPPGCFSRYECHPFRSFPLNSNCHPSLFSWVVSAFCSCAHAMPADNTQAAAAIDNFLRFIVSSFEEICLRNAVMRGWNVRRDSPRVVARYPVEEQGHEATFIGFEANLGIRRALYRSRKALVIYFE